MGDVHAQGDLFGLECGLEGDTCFYDVGVLLGCTKEVFLEIYVDSSFDAMGGS